MTMHNHTTLTAHLRPLLMASFIAIVALCSLMPIPTWADEEDVVTKRTYTVPRSAGDIYAATNDQPACELTAYLTWRRGRKLVRVEYEWQHCSGDEEIHWKLDLNSVQKASGTFILSENGERRVYDQKWPILTDGDKIRLHTHINDLPQYTVETTYLDKKPIFVKIHTAKRNDGACFQFSGRVDPWGVFTAGNKSHKFHLDTEYWTTPWVEGPNSPKVDWNAKFYEDAELTILRSEYTFRNVENPCYQPEPPRCDGVRLSVPNGSPIPASGSDVEVIISASNATYYRIVNKANDEIVAGPSTSPDFTIHVLPNTIYQAQVSADGTTWTDEGCEIRYTQVPSIPRCLGVTKIDPVEREFIPATGRTVKVEITADDATYNRIINKQTKKSVAEASTEFTREFFARPNTIYQAQVSADGTTWTDDGCEFQYKGVSPSTCLGVNKIDPSEGELIPDKGQIVKVEVKAKNAAYNRIVKTKTGEIVAPPSTELFRDFFAHPRIVYQAQVSVDGITWFIGSCEVKYDSAPPAKCFAVIKIDPLEGERIPAAGRIVTVKVDAVDATYYRIINKATGGVVAEKSTEPIREFFAWPGVIYQAQVSTDGVTWTDEGCDIHYLPEPLSPACISVASTPANGSEISDEGAAIKATITAENATQYRVVVDGTISGPKQLPDLNFYAMPEIRYQIEVSDENGEIWNGSPNCILSFEAKPVYVQCNSISKPKVAASASTSKVMVTITCHATNATHYQVLDDNDMVIVPETTSNTMTFEARRGVIYHVEVRNATSDWQRSPDCMFQLPPQQVHHFCTLKADHYGDPGGLAWIEAWRENEAGERQVAPMPLNQIVIDWNGKGRVTYTSAKSIVPWTTNQVLDFDSRPDVHDIGFGRYHFQAWVYIQGVGEPVYCDDIGHAQDHDNVVPDPGPFAKDNPEGKFNRGDAPSRLPTVARLPFDGGNGPEKIELILWAFEKEGNGTSARITALANEGKPLARLGMASVTDFAKFDGLPAREGIVYGFQIGEHGPWGPLFCPKPDSNPTTITVFWGAGGQTWLSDGAAYGDCWWLTVAAARNGWVTVEESVATYNALQPIIDWNGHRNLVFSTAQDRTTGQGPRMQDMVIGLQAQEWQGPVVPQVLPADFDKVLMGYQANE